MTKSSIYSPSLGQAPPDDFLKVANAFESFQKFCEPIQKRNVNLVFESCIDRSWCWWLWFMDTGKDTGKYWGIPCPVFHSWKIDTLSLNGSTGVQCHHHCNYNYRDRQQLLPANYRVVS